MMSSSYTTVISDVQQDEIKRRRLVSAPVIHGIPSEDEREKGKNQLNSLDWFSCNGELKCD